MGGRPDVDVLVDGVDGLHLPIHKSQITHSSPHLGGVPVKEFSQDKKIVNKILALVKP